MDSVVLIIFIIVYLAMILGRIPGLALDRAGVALLGAIALLVFGKVGNDELTLAVNIPTMGLLFGLMIISAQFRLAGFYSFIIRRTAVAKLSPRLLLALLIGTVAVLSAVLANDIVCLAAAPVLIEACSRRGLDPKPFLLALACSANIGSAATLIGNPQNMLIGEVLHLSFSGYLQIAAVPSVLGLIVVWGVICMITGKNWFMTTQVSKSKARPLSRWQTAKGLVVLAGIIVIFLVGPWPREIVALAAAAILLFSHQLSSRKIIEQVDWQLLVLFFGLFVVNYALKTSGILDEISNLLLANNINLEQPTWLFGISAILSNIVSNVPAVMFLLPSATHPMAGPILALSSTLAGNFIIVGSIANMIVVEQARMMNVKISWLDHARIGIPVTLITLGVAAGWLLLIGI